MHTACHNVYTLTAHVTGFRTVLVTLHALVYERNAASQLTYSITLATEQRHQVEYSYWTYHMAALGCSVVLIVSCVLLVVVSLQRPYFFPCKQL